MKPVGCFSRLVTWGVALAAVWTVGSARAATGRAVAGYIRGTASYAEQGGEWKPLKSGQALGPGSSVKTGVDGAAVLTMGPNGTDVQLYDSTTLGFDRLNVENTGAESVIETQLNLTTGTIRGDVQKLSAASKYEVKTPNVVFGVRGTTPTKYVISANGVTHVIEGSAVVVYINPSTKEMNNFNVGAGQTFEPPVNPSAPGAAPKVRPTRPDEVPPVVGPTVTPVSGLVVVPSPEPFVSPVRPHISGQAVNTTPPGD